MGYSFANEAIDYKCKSKRNISECSWLHRPRATYIVQAKSGTETDYTTALGSESQQKEAKSNMSLLKHWKTMREEHQALMVRLMNAITTVKRENVFGSTLAADLPGEPPSSVGQAWNVRCFAASYLILIINTFSQPFAGCRRSFETSGFMDIASIRRECGEACRLKHDKRS